MSIIEIQIRTDRFCELVRGELNSRVLPSPTLSLPLVLAGKQLERIECLSCRLDGPSAGSGEAIFVGELAFKFHPSLESIRAAGSLQPPATADEVIPFKLIFTIAFDPALPKPPELSYALTLILGAGVLPAEMGRFPLDVPDGLGVQSAAIEASADIVAIRLGLHRDDPVRDAPVDRIGQGEWRQVIPGDFIAEQIRAILDRSLDEAVLPPPPPDPNKPWLPKPKPRELEKGTAAHAAWFPGISLVGPQSPFALAQGEIIAVDACPLFDVDISIEVSLNVGFEFPLPETMRVVAMLTWDADSTWCDVLATLLLGVPFGIGFNVAAEDGVSDAVLGTSVSPGAGFEEIGRTDRSITFAGIRSVFSPSSEFVATRSEATAEGQVMTGFIRPKIAPLLAGQMIPATAGQHIDCNLRAVSMVFNPAQVILRNAAPGYAGKPPRVFLESTIFQPAGAWVIDTDRVNMSDPHSTSAQTVLTFVDPPTGRLPAGAHTSVFLFTDYGVRWVNFGEVPRVPKQPPPEAKLLMNKYCDSISNPWGHGMTRLDWGVDPLLDPDYEHLFRIDPVRLWTVGLRELPESARIDFLALARDGSERLLGTVEGQRSAALQLVTAGTEALGMRPQAPFAAPAPTLARNWVFPFAALSLESDPVTIASARGLLGIRDRDGTTRILDPRNVEEVGTYDRRVPRRPDARDRHVTNVLAREEARGRRAWATAAALDKSTIAITHRGQVLIGTVGTSRRVQKR